MYSYRSRDKGSLLILTLWVLFLLGALALAMNSYVWPQLNFAGRFRDRAIGEYLGKAAAKAAVEVVTEDKISTFSALNGPWSNNEAVFKEKAAGAGAFSISYEFDPNGQGQMETRYGLIDEERKININKVPQKVLKNFFMTVATADEEKADELSACVVDWRSAGEVALQNGAKSAYYMSLDPPYPCKDAEFQSLDELLQVKGMTREIFEAIKSRATVYGLGQVNINTADSLVLQSIGMSRETVEKIVNYRKGGDGEEGTADDNVFVSVSGIAEALAKSGKFSSTELAQLNGIINSGLLTVRSDNYMGRATGAVNGRRSAFGITFIFNRNKVMKYWRED